MADKDKYKGPTPEEMDRAARMIEANIPPMAPSRLRDTNPMPVSKEENKMLMDEAVKMMRPKEKKETPAEALGKAAPKKSYKKGGMVKSSASKRADGCATKGKTKGRII